MANFHDALNERHVAFITAPKMYFVATAPLCDAGRIHLSPKRYDSFRVIGPRRVAYADLGGPGAQTLATQRQYASSRAFYANHIVIPPGYATIRLPRIIPDEAAFGGDTQAQAGSVFRKIASALQEAGASEGDVVAMSVYLAAPAPGGNMDFDGMMRAYGRHYGSDEQPNRPVRSTVPVAGLVRPGILVEIEVTAAVPASR
jgi:enamine deaminase RidA (YjgF/YER057c/UK114 family)